MGIDHGGLTRELGELHCAGFEGTDGHDRFGGVDRDVLPPRFRVLLILAVPTGLVHCRLLLRRFWFSPWVKLRLRWRLTVLGLTVLGLTVLRLTVSTTVATIARSVARAVLPTILILFAGRCSDGEKRKSKF